MRKDGARIRRLGWEWEGGLGWRGWGGFRRGTGGWGWGRMGLG